MNIPKHIAVIPDGNRRWANRNHLLPIMGHKKAFEETLPDLLEKAQELGIKYFTFWALSTENLVKRSPKEVEALFTLGRNFYGKKLQELKEKGVQIRFIGNIPDLPADIQKIIKDATEETKNNTKITFIIAINYGGKDEVMRALQKVISMNYLAKSVNKENFDQFLDTNGIPDPDLIIRTGGEKRLSGFMMWQSTYSEFYFSDLFFPDFTPEELERALEYFNDVKRNFGK